CECCPKANLGKREIKREHLALFIDAYEEATGETFDLVDSETPDFIGRDRQGRVVGIEVTRFQFDPKDRWMRRTFGGGESFDEDAWWKLLGLLHQKDGKLAKGRWHLCERKILVVMLIDCPATRDRRKLRYRPPERFWLRRSLASRLHAGRGLWRRR